MSRYKRALRRDKHLTSLSVNMTHQSRPWCTWPSDYCSWHSSPTAAPFFFSERTPLGSIPPMSSIHNPQKQITPPKQTSAQTLPSNNLLPSQGISTQESCPVIAPSLLGRNTLRSSKCTRSFNPEVFVLTNCPVDRVNNRRTPTMVGNIV